MTNLTAKKIKHLLAKKHSDDLFVTECKTGKADSQILDAWAMKKSWTNQAHYGYEIKVSRSDFLQDDKWKAYLDYCNQFYFVCPYKMIQKEELPKEVGLMWVASTGTRLYTKKKAPSRKVDIVDSIYKYILMNRIRISDSTFGSPLRRRDPKKYWQQWLADKKLNREFGRMVGEKIWEYVQENVKEVERKNQSLKSENGQLQKYKELKKDLNELGINPWDIRRLISDGIETAVGKRIKSFRYTLKSASDRLAEAVEKVDQYLEEETE